MNIEKAREIAKTAWNTPTTICLGKNIPLLDAFANILAEQTTDAFLKGVQFGKGYKEEE